MLTGIKDRKEIRREIEQLEQTTGIDHMSASQKILSIKPQFVNNQLTNIFGSQISNSDELLQQQDVENQLISASELDRQQDVSLESNLMQKVFKRFSLQSASKDTNQSNTSL